MGSGISGIIDRTRKNHAIEHGTVSVLLERGARTPIAGNATPWGFFIYGYATTEEVEKAAAEALHRLHAGESELAVSPYCGTNLVVGALLAGLLSGVILRGHEGRVRRLPVAMTAILLSTMLGRPIGNMVQRHYTTLADVEGIEITRTSTLQLGRFAIHRIATSG